MSEHPAHPAIEPTTPSWVVVAAMLGGGLAWLVFSTLQRLGESLPRLEPIAWLSVAVLAGATGWLAVTTTSTVRTHRQDLSPSAAVNRLLLGKTSILAGAGLGAAYLVLVLLALPGWPAPLAQGRVLHGSVAAALSVAWAAAGWLLERACRVPRDPENPPPEPDSADSPR